MAVGMFTVAKPPPASCLARLTLLPVTPTTSSSMSPVMSAAPRMLPLTLIATGLKLNSVTTGGPSVNSKSNPLFSQRSSNAMRYVRPDDTWTVAVARVLPS